MLSPRVDFPRSHPLSCIDRQGHQGAEQRLRVSAGHTQSRDEGHTADDSAVPASPP